MGGRTQLRREELAEAASAGADFSVLTSDDPGSGTWPSCGRCRQGHMASVPPYACIPDRYEAIQAAVHGPARRHGTVCGRGCRTPAGGRPEDLPFRERAFIEQVCRALRPEDAAAR